MNNNLLTYSNIFPQINPYAINKTVILQPQPQPQPQIIHPQLNKLINWHYLDISNVPKENIEKMRKVFYYECYL